MITSEHNFYQHIPILTDRRAPRARPDGAPKRQILVVDDHPMTREGLACVVNGESDLETCGSVSSPAEAIVHLFTIKPDLVLTDMSMPGRSGFDFLSDIHAVQPELSILVLSVHDEVLYAQRALRAGARGYLMKDAGRVKILEAIRTVLKGQIYVSSQISARLVESATGHKPRGSTSPIEKLSSREFEVFRLIGQGKNTVEVAEQLHLSPKTVAAHRANIKSKLNLTAAASLFHFAVRWEELDAAKAFEKGSDLSVENSFPAQTTFAL